jgi:valyl-tRNA synthetase
LIVAPWPKAQAFDQEILNDFTSMMEIVSGVRNLRKEKNIAQKEQIELHALLNKEVSKKFDPVVMHLCNLSTFDYVESKPEAAFSFFIDANEYFVPFSEEIDIEAEIEKLQKELEYELGFLQSVERKLSNEKFVSGAPAAVVDIEKKKQHDALERVRVIEGKLASLK